jgi:hypothetical protein
VNLYPLPDLVFIEEWNGNWTQYYENIHQIFLETIPDKLTFLGLPVRCRYWEPIDGKHRVFWHLITASINDGSKDEERIPDLRRCERIQWIAHIIRNNDDPSIMCWENRRGRHTNVVLWLPDENYQVVLSQRNGYYLLTTAYVHDAYRAIKNRRECEESTDPRKKQRP